MLVLRAEAILCRSLKDDGGFVDPESTQLRRSFRDDVAH